MSWKTFFYVWLALAVVLMFVLGVGVLKAQTAEMVVDKAVAIKSERLVLAGAHFLAPVVKDGRQVVPDSRFQELKSMAVAVDSKTDSAKVCDTYKVIYLDPEKYFI
jgi:hypothetical protein